MKRFLHPVYITLVVCITLAFVFSLSTHAQNVVRNGNTFIQQVDSTRVKKEPTKTKYTYVSKDGVSYPIYLSANGKAFIMRYSSKTDKMYRQYLPEVTKQLQGK